VDPTQDGTEEDARVAEIRSEVEGARLRIVETLDALEYKADVPARLADVLSATASSLTARVLASIPTPGGSRVDQDDDEEIAAQPRIHG
jgi:Protein of unknown function (DUF3618)